MLKKTFRDQMQREVQLNFPPKKIISIVPSQTELLYDLGLENEVIGITKFCVHPDSWFRSKTRIGGTKTVKLDLIRQLQPDLIIGNKEENQKDQIEALSAEFPVWMSDIATISDAFEMIRLLGKLTDRKAAAQDLTHSLEQQFSNFKNSHSNRPPKSAAYFIWKEPYMVAASGTFIHEMMTQAGFENVFGTATRYPEIQMAELKTKAPEVILLSSEPFPFQEKHFAPFQEACPQAKILIVDGEMFSWYGSRLLHSVPYFKALHTQIW